MVFKKEIKFFIVCMFCWLWEDLFLLVVFFYDGEYFDILFYMDILFCSCVCLFFYVMMLRC